MTKDGKLDYWNKIKSIKRDKGLLKGIYRGFWATFWRDVPNWGVYFMCFEKLKQKGNMI